MATALENELALSGTGESKINWCNSTILTSKNLCRE